MDLFHWTLHDLDATDLESLIPFFQYYARRKARSPQAETPKIYADQASFLPG